MWTRLNDLAPDDYTLLAIFRHLDKIKQLSQEQLEKLDQVIPEQKLMEYIQAYSNSHRFHDRLNKDHKIKRKENDRANR